jgi:hypothetical protein
VRGYHPTCENRAGLSGHRSHTMGSASGSENLPDHHHRLLLFRKVSLLTPYIFFVFLAWTSALSQRPFQRNGPVKRFPSAIQQDSLLSAPEKTFVPRFRGWSHSTRSAMLDQYNHVGVGRSSSSYTATHRLRNSSTQPTLPFNGFGFRPTLRAGQIPTAVAARETSTVTAGWTGPSRTGKTTAYGSISARATALLTYPQFSRRQALHRYG